MEGEKGKEKERKGRGVMEGRREGDRGVRGSRMVSHFKDRLIRG